MKHILLVADVPKWAFDQNLRDMTRYITDFQYSFWYTKNGDPPHSGFDAMFIPWHRHYLAVEAGGVLFPPLPNMPVLSSLRSERFNANTTDPVTVNDIKLVNSYHGFHVVTQKNYDELKPYCPRVVYLTNPVDIGLFPKETTEKGLVACWCGNTNHATDKEADIKGFYKIILPACSMTKIPIVFAEYNTNRYQPWDMPDFFRQASVYVCASLYEGASNAVMEAMASGLALVTTNCGNAIEMQSQQMRDYGDTGIMVIGRRKESFVAALSLLSKKPDRVRDMGAINRKSIQDHWSWSVWADRYRDFLRMAF